MKEDMSEEAVKKRIKRAIEAATKCLKYPPGRCEVIQLSNYVFHIEAIRKKEICKIRIVLDEITKRDEDLVRNFELPENCTREIWCRKINGSFEVKEIRK